MDEHGAVVRAASPDEAETLARYVGWGGLAKAVDDVERIRRRMDRGGESPTDAIARLSLSGEGQDEDYERLVQLFETPILDERRWQSIAATTLNAHYTQPYVARAMWGALERLGFDAGRVIEPGSGTGLFIGAMPDSLRDETAVHAVEIDPISASISKALYPSAYTESKGFQSLRAANHAGQYEAVIGNVPYGSYAVADPEYDHHKANIHNHFMMKALDFVQPGGVAAMLTSRWTLDAATPTARQRLAERGELIGAVRLPRGAFSSIANTDVTEDLLIFKRVDRPGLVGAPDEALPRWARRGDVLGYYEDNAVTVSPYFVDHPEQVLGEMHIESGRFRAGEIVVKHAEGESLETLPERLEAAIERIIPDEPAFSPHGPAHHRLYDAAQSASTSIRPGQAIAVETGAINNYRPGSLVLGEDGQTPMSVVHVDVDSETVQAEPVPTGRSAKRGEVPAARLANLAAMIELRDAVVETLSEQQDASGDSTAARDRLNTLYDAYVAEHGPLNLPQNARYFAQDPQSNLLLGIEHYSDETKTAEKAAIFHQRIIEPAHVPDHADSAEDALAICLANTGNIVPAFITELLGEPESAWDQLVGKDGPLKGKVFINPETARWESAAFYLAGNIQQKIEAAERASATDERFSANVSALQASLPERISAEQIPARLAAPWLEQATIEHYIARTMGAEHAIADPSAYFNLDFEPLTSKWRLVKGNDESSYRRGLRTDRAQDLSTDKKNFLNLVGAKLNNTPIRVTYKVKTDDGKERSVLDTEATLAAVEKGERVEADFREWLWSDETRAHYYEDKYNREYNSFRRMQADGSHMSFPGMSKAISLYPHQKDAVWFAISNRKALFAHEVGTGKTFAQIATAMEMNRLGVAKRAFMVVKRSTLNQFAASARAAYPAARIVTVDPSAMNRVGRERFLGQLAVQDFDMAIMSQETFAKIGVSEERQRSYVERRVADMREAYAEAVDSEGENAPSTKTIAKKVKELEARVERFINRRQQNGPSSSVTIEQINPGAVFYDESQALKNLDTQSSTQGLASNSGSDRSETALMMFRVLEEQNPGFVKVFSSGTPISNSFAEVHTLFRFLDRPMLNHLAGDTNEESIDRFAGQFIRTTQAVELGVEGYYKTRDRISVEAIPELMGAMQFMDTRFADDIGVERPTMHSTTITAKPTLAQTVMRFEIMDRADAIKAKAVDPSKDNFLKLAGDGRKAATDMRLIDPRLPDDPGSKINLAVANIVERYKTSAPDLGTQAVFLDQGTPKANAEDQTTINLYADIRDKLVERGIPGHEVAFIHEAKTDKDREKLFEAVNAGKVRVIIGSTEKMGVGANMQERMVAGHHIDPPAYMRPSDMEQRIGRFQRQGNRNEAVENLVYTTESSFDLYIFQLMEAKQKVLNAVLRGDQSIREIDEDADMASYDDIMAATTGSPAIKEKIEVDGEAKKLEAQVKDRQNQAVRARKQYNLASSQLAQHQRSYDHIGAVREHAEAALARCDASTRESAAYWSMPVVVVTDDKDRETVMLDACGSGASLADQRKAIGEDQWDEARVRRETRTMDADTLREVMSTTRAALIHGLTTRFSPYQRIGHQFECVGEMLDTPVAVRLAADSMNVNDAREPANKRMKSNVTFHIDRRIEGVPAMNAPYPAAVEQKVFDERDYQSGYARSIERLSAEVAQYEQKINEGDDALYAQFAEVKKRQADAAERAEAAIDDIRAEREGIPYATVEAYADAVHRGLETPATTDADDYDPLAADDALDPLDDADEPDHRAVASKPLDFSP